MENQKVEMLENIEVKTKEKKDIFDEGRKDQNYRADITKGEISAHWFFFWRMFGKAKKMNKRIKIDINHYTEEYRYRWMQKISKKVLKVAKIRLHVFGQENWLDKGVVLAPNHQSNLDPLVLFVLNDWSKTQPVAFMAKKEMWDSDKTARFVNLIDCVSLDRNSPRSALDAMNQAKTLITKYRRSFVIFPEGTRSGTEKMAEFQAASMKIGQMAYCPIIPVTIIDSYKLNRKDRPKVINVKVVFGKPILPEKFMSIKTDMLTRNVQKEVQFNYDKYKDFDLKTNKPVAYNKKTKVKYYS
ncbi:1-acyl-sn-glycerol-3-phosphate acyltransferase [Spiroplasma sp. TIUS-1]|uniref:lysophospholipid acyltransferase family protein n=1 Tax=Spiroplasma sp. TIUS-1 TaxID=216963 RepID=UPI001397F1C9|nr:lysophospholipid acyltransferase family protein [Spiroplasma sp. TIUS-1]QHX35985.1 1-acyl-sn-glycerol-3-phosphate acyltransferase [Spiroplasma sp. TIUS-1]